MEIPTPNLSPATEPDLLNNKPFYSKQKPMGTLPQINRTPKKNFLNWAFC